VYNARQPKSPPATKVETTTRELLSDSAIIVPCGFNKKYGALWRVV
jgi:hypothetical protein